MARGERRHRLTGNGAFEAVLRGGRRRSGAYLEIIAMPAARECGRYGMVIGRKVMPRAVDRNRVRRMLRVVLRASPTLEGYDLIDVMGGVSTLSNCGGFPLAFDNGELNRVGLLAALDRAHAVRAALRSNYPDEPHANCDVWAIFRARQS